MTNHNIINSILKFLAKDKEDQLILPVTIALKLILKPKMHHNHHNILHPKCTLEKKEQNLVIQN